METVFKICLWGWDSVNDIDWGQMTLYSVGMKTLKNQIGILLNNFKSLLGWNILEKKKQNIPVVFLVLSLEWGEWRGRVQFTIKDSQDHSDSPPQL